MRHSQLFLPTRREGPRDELSPNAQWLLRAGYADKLMAGVYTLLPLGLMVSRAIEGIIREEMSALGAQELVMPALHPKSAWEPSGRWKTLAPIMYQFQDHAGRDVGLGTTHEEIIAALVQPAISSYRDLPLALYQFQLKFRDELRPKSGLIRLREFVMKDLYSFHATVEDLDLYYERVKAAYQKIFTRCGLNAMVLEASGGEFTPEFSHEFSVLSDAGEDRIVYCPTCTWAQNSEVATRKAGEQCPKNDGVLREATAVEVGNIFKLGTRFSQAFGVQFAAESGEKQPVIMASYGIGVARVLATLAEVHHDEFGLRWPVSVAPFLGHVIGLGVGEEKAAAFEKKASRQGIPVFLADRKQTAGAHFAMADLLGFPVRLVFSEKTGDKVEWKERGSTAEAMLLAPDEALDKLSGLRARL